MESLGAGALAEIRKEAAAWLIQMDTDPDGWNRRAFLEWLKLSPSHMEEFQLSASLWLALHDTNALDIESLCQLPDRSNVTELVSGAQHGEKRTELQTTEDVTVAGTSKRRVWLAGLAASVLLVAAAWLWFAILQHQTQVLMTSVGEQRIVRLPDRSVVHLNTNSRVEVRFTDKVRDIRLIQGEALFTVERDVNRPFRVQTDDARLQALGTQFNVRRRRSDTVVSVIEGRVALVGAGARPAGSSVSREEAYEADRPPLPGTLAVVDAGEQIQVSEDGRVEERAIQDVSATTAWQQRRLVLNNVPLGEVVSEIERYIVSPQIQIQGDVLRTRRINGIFAVDNPESLIEFSLAIRRWSWSDEVRWLRCGCGRV